MVQATPRHRTYGGWSVDDVSWGNSVAGSRCTSSISVAASKEWRRGEAIRAAACGSIGSVQGRSRQIAFVARNVNWEPPLPSLFLLPFSLSSSSLSSLFFPSLPLSLSSLFPLFIYSRLEGLGERCKLLQRGLGRSFSRNQIWCIVALEYEIWCQQF